MKMLHLIKSLGRGGAEMLLPETVALHNRKDFEFHCLYFLPWKNQMVEALVALGAKVECLQAGSNLKMLSKVPAVIRYCKQHNIDIIHCHLPWAGFVGRMVHMISGIPVVYTEHNKQERYNRITARLNRITFNWQNKAIAVSNDVAESIQKNIKPAIAVQTVLNGANTQKFIRDAAKGKSIRQQYGISDDAVVIGTVAVFRFQKRLSEWLEQMKLITEKHPHVRGIIVGDGPLKDEIISKRKLLGLEENVIMPGLQTNTIDWFSAMDIFMMTSVFEGLPIALLEAMSCECAVVSTDAGGIKEVIRDGADGLLCDVDDFNHIHLRADELINSAERLSAMQKAARLRVQQHFSLQAMVNALEKLYIQTVKEKRI